MRPAKEDCLHGRRTHTPENLRGGFSLIELLTVVAIISILAAILIPVTHNVLRAGRTVSDASNLRTIALANQMYAADNAGQSVMAYGIPPEGGTVLWYQDLRPYLGYEKERDKEVNIFISPSDPEEGGRLASPPIVDWSRRSYSVNYGIRIYVSANVYKRRTLTTMDPSKMIFACNHKATEIGTHGIMTTSQASMDLIPLDWHSVYGSAQFVFIDGHVEMIQVELVDLKNKDKEGSRYGDWSAYYEMETRD